MSGEPKPQPKPTELVLYGAEWCGPCKGAKAALFGVEYRYVDIDQDQTEAIENGIQAVPTLIAKKDGVVVGRVAQGVTRASVLALQKMIG